MPLESKQNRLLQVATYLSVGTALLLISLKLFAWFLSDSVSILSTLLDSFLDLLASGLSLFAIRHALVPADKEHRFGHGKAEPLAALGQSGFILGSAVFVLIEAAAHISQQKLILNTHIGMLIMVLSIIITLALVSFQRYVIKETHSEIIEADALHYKTDLMINLSVFVSLALSGNFELFFIDGLFGAVIAIFMIISVKKIIETSLDSLMDRELPESDRANIKALVLANPGVKGLHDLRTRKAGRIRFIQLHLEMDGNKPLFEAHRISDDVERALRNAYAPAEIIIHGDPEGLKERRDTF